MLPPNQRSINIPGRILDAWRTAILGMAKLPRGTPRSEFTPDDLLNKIQKQETKTVIELWETFTQERANLSRGLLGTARQTVAYLLGFHLVNAARAMLLLRRLDERHALTAWVKRLAASPHPIVWHDLGCGTGAIAQVVSDYLIHSGLPLGRLELHLYDGVGTLLDAATAVLSASGLAPKTHRVGLESLDPARLVASTDPRVRGFSLGYVWNELEKNPLARQRLKGIFAAQVAAKTMLLVLEPATQAQSRAAMELRDELVAFGYVPLYPCSSAAPCPMLNLSRDWCFSEGEWQQPKPMQILDKALGIDRTRLNGTLLAFASPTLAADLALKDAANSEAVIVGRPERLGKKGAVDYLLCQAGELRKSPLAPGAPAQARGTTLAGPKV
jgi:hypothetical protein